MKTFEVPKCFWMPEIVDTDCDCKKVYVDLNIDFEKTRVYMCKDWFVFEIKRILDENYTDGLNFRYGFSGKECNDAREYLYREIINDYVKQPIVESLKIKRIPDHRYKGHPNLEFSNSYDVSNPLDIKMGIAICERPFIYEDVSVIKYIQYVQSIDDYTVMHEHIGNYNKAVDAIFKWLERKIVFKKYSKYKKIYYRLKHDSLLSESHCVNLNELIIELINIVVK